MIVFLPELLEVVNRSIWSLRFEVRRREAIGLWNSGRKGFPLCWVACSECVRSTSCKNLTLDMKRNGELEANAVMFFLPLNASACATFLALNSLGSWTLWPSDEGRFGSKKGRRFCRAAVRRTDDLSSSLFWSHQKHTHLILTGDYWLFLRIHAPPLLYLVVFDLGSLHYSRKADSHVQMILMHTWFHL